MCDKARILKKLQEYGQASPEVMMLLQALLGESMNPRRT
jgi:hypothetical protein